MIDTRQLHIGAHVLVGDKRVKVLGITQRKIGYHDGNPKGHLHYARLHEIEPIAITPALLTELGFEERRVEYPYGKPDVWYVDPESARLEKRHDLIVPTVSVFPLGKIGMPDLWKIKVFVGDGLGKDGNCIVRYLHELESFLALHNVELLAD